MSPHLNQEFEFLDAYRLKHVLMMRSTYNRIGHPSGIGYLDFTSNTGLTKLGHISG